LSPMNYSIRLLAALSALCLIASASNASTCGDGIISGDATDGQLETFFESANKHVLTFIGYSGAEYEDHEAMLAIARRVLDEFDPAETIVNIGATPDGIGAVYRMAKDRGFETTGIVSTQAKKYEVASSPCVDHVFYVEDGTWGGLLDGSDRLSPTSAAMVEYSDTVIGIGGGEIGRDELQAAGDRGKDVRFFPADMNHEIAIEKAKKKGLPPPTRFDGAASQAFSTSGKE
jgi:hypothetical protein